MERIVPFQGAANLVAAQHPVDVFEETWAQTYWRAWTVVVRSTFSVRREPRDEGNVDVESSLSIVWLLFHETECGALYKS